jgi:RHS repeat-associated protein
LMSMSGTINGQNRAQTFTYDNVGRLLTATGWSAWQRRFAYDRWGNRTGMWDATTGGNQIQNIVIAPNGSSTKNNRIYSVNGVLYGYDAAGNCTYDGAHNYGYDGEGRLANVDSGATASYGYDANNWRVKKLSGGVTTHYVWEGAQVIAEYNGSTGALISEYVHAGSRMVARDQGGVLRYFHQDRLSTRMITDGSGNVVGTQDHLPFGEDAGVVGESEKHRFTTYERDTESGTDQAVHRQYHVNVGRFFRPDPVPGSISNPQSLNRYAYVSNQPTNLTDPTGLDWFSTWISAASQNNFANGAAFAAWILDQEDRAFFGYHYYDLPGYENIREQEEARHISIITTGYDPEFPPIELSDGLQAARKALKRKSCRDYLAGQFGQDPLALLNKLVDKGQFSYGDPNDKEFGPGEPGYTLGTGENAKVTFDPGVNTRQFFRAGIRGLAHHIRMRRVESLGSAPKPS